jgi:hypothetical protein
MRVGAGLPGGPSLLASGYSRARRNRNKFPTTERELSVMAALAQMGLIRSPKKGYSTPAATGTLKALYMNARNRFWRMFLIVARLSCRAPAMPLISLPVTRPDQR